MRRSQPRSSFPVSTTATRWLCWVQWAMRRLSLCFTIQSSTKLEFILFTSMLTAYALQLSLMTICHASMKISWCLPSAKMIPSGSAWLKRHGPRSMDLIIASALLFHYVTQASSWMECQARLSTMEKMTMTRTSSTSRILSWISTTSSSLPTRVASRTSNIAA